MSRKPSETTIDPHGSIPAGRGFRQHTDMGHEAGTANYRKCFDLRVSLATPGKVGLRPGGG
jgi:hypothetical protein